MYAFMNYSCQCFVFSCSFPVWPPLGLLLFLGTHSWGADSSVCVCDFGDGGEGLRFNYFPQQWVHIHEGRGRGWGTGVGAKEELG